MNATAETETSNVSEPDGERICTYDPLVAFMARFETVKAVATGEDPFAGLSPEEALVKHVVDGVKKGLETRLLAMLETRPALSIVNDVLLEGMRRVGELFGAGKMQLPFVLGSAEVMKTAVALLEPHMPRADAESERGSILLATVAGDVHDIGKNLVDIILTNNGYRVVNIGIKQPIGAILEAQAKHRCDAIGLSGLLVKSTVIMRENLLELNRRGLAHTPVILGGAALTRAYVEEDLAALYEGRVHYAKDAFEGLAIMERLHDPLPETTPNPEVPDERRVATHRADDLPASLFVFDGVRSETAVLDEIPALPFAGSRTRTKFDPYEIAAFINPVALFRGQWQLKRGEGQGNPEFEAWLEANARPVLDRLLREMGRVFAPRVAWGYFPCRGDGNALVVYAEDGRTERARLDFPRQSGGKRLCLADFFRPLGHPGPHDVVGFSAVTMGDGVSEYERDLFARGEYEEYLYVHGLGVEMAEALAEFWHLQMRRELGLPGEPATKKELFGAKYRGARYSFGYPACPRLEDQHALFALLEPQRVGIHLTEELMLTPEQSTTAMVVHHPEARYFHVR